MTHGTTVRAGALMPVLSTSLVVLSTLWLSACSDDDAQDLPIATANDLQGVWEQTGYGLFLSIDDQRLTIYEATRASCHLRDAGQAAELLAEFPDIHVDDHHLQLSESVLDSPMLFDRVDGLPVVCDEPIDDSPTAQFDHLWHSYNDYYAFFEERGVDWLAQYDQWRATISEQSSRDALAEAMIGLVSVIDDVHVSLEFGNEGVFSPATQKGLIQDLIEEYQSQGGVEDEIGYVNSVLDQWRQDLQDHYLGQAFSTTDNDYARLMEWGVMGGNVGYLSITQLFTDFESSGVEQIAVFDAVLDAALSDLAGTSALIIDLRLTPGGRDAVSVAIANRFADTERQALSKFPRSYLGDGDAHTFTIRPSERQNYPNPVIVLTSGYSASATETLTLLLRSLPQVTHLGEASNGALSDILERELPNGWLFTLSNEVYRDVDGQVHEGTGIAPHIVVPVLEKSARDRGQDSAIDAAYEQLGIANPVSSPQE